MAGLVTKEMGNEAAGRMVGQKQTRIVAHGAETSFLTGLGDILGQDMIHAAHLKIR